MSGLNWGDESADVGLNDPQITKKQAITAYGDLVEDADYLIYRLEEVIELINQGSTHMACAKLLADISALKARAS